MCLGRNIISFLISFVFTSMHQMLKKSGLPQITLSRDLIKMNMRRKKIWWNLQSLKTWIFRPTPTFQQIKSVQNEWMNEWMSWAMSILILYVWYSITLSCRHLKVLIMVIWKCYKVIEILHFITKQHCYYTSEVLLPVTCD